MTKIPIIKTVQDEDMAQTLDRVSTASEPSRPLMTGMMFMLGAAFLFAILSLLIKILGSRYRVWDIGMYRFGGSFVLLLAIFGRRQDLFRPDNLKLMIIRSITGLVAFVCCVTALRLIPLSTAVVFLFSFPAFAALFSALLFKDRITGFGMFCVGVALAGVGILFDFRLEGGVFGQTMGLLSGVFAGLTVVLIKRLRETNGTVTIYFFFCLLGTGLIFFPFMSDPQLPGSGTEILIVAGIIITATMGQLLMNQGVFYCRSWEGGLFMTSEVIFAAILGVLFFSESLSWRFWTGGLLIFISAVAINRTQIRRNI